MKWRHSQAVRQRSATPLSPVRFRVAPPKREGYPLGCPSLFAVITKSDGFCVFAAESGSQHSECRWHSEIPGGTSKKSNSKELDFFICVRRTQHHLRDCTPPRNITRRILKYIGRSDIINSEMRCKYAGFLKLHRQ